MISKAKKIIEKCINDLENKAIPDLGTQAALLVEAAIMHLAQALEFEEETNDSEKKVLR